MGKLTAKQALFVKEYLVDLNATQAAIRAGYSEKTARIIGAQNLAKLNIQEAITEGTQGRNDKLELDGDIYVQRTYNTVKTTIKDILKFDPAMGGWVHRPPEEIPDYAWGSIKKMDTVYLPDGGGMQVRTEMFDPNAARKDGLTMGGKLIEKHEVSGNFNVTISPKDADTL